MLTVYQADLPVGYVVVLASSTSAVAEPELGGTLRRACLSGRRAVLIDCRLLHSLPRAAARRLWAFHLRQWRRGGRLVLCHVSEAVGRILGEAAAATGPALHIAPTLDEAAYLATG